MPAVASFSAIEPYLIQAESGGSNTLCTLPGCPGVANPGGAPVSTAGGYFQITNSTWGGVPQSVSQGYSTALAAPFAVQQAVAQWLWNANNGGDWLGNPATGYAGNPAIIAANASLMTGQAPAAPLSSAVNSLVAAGTSASGAAPATAGTVCGPQYLGLFGPTTCWNPGGQQINPASVPAAVAAGNPTGIVAGIEGWLGSVAGNVGIGILAIVLLLIAVWPQARITITRAVKGA